MNPIVLVQLEVRSVGDGGRHAPFTDGYAPHLVVADTTDWLGVRARNTDPIYPGESAEVPFELMYFGEVDYSGLKTGARVSMMEGTRVVGDGVVNRGVELIEVDH